MADPVEDEKTLDTSKSGESENQTDESVTKVEGTEAGKATEDNESTEEGAQKPRNEVRHDRYIDKLSKEIQEHNARDNNTTDLFSTDKSYKPTEYKEGEEYDPKAIEEDRLAFGKNRFAEGLNTGFRQGESQVNTKLWETNFDIDGERVSAKYEDKLTPDVEKDLVQDYIAFIGMTKDERTGRITIQKPSVRFKDFAEAEFNKMDRYATAQKNKSVDNVNKQSQKTGVRPSGQARATTGGNGFDDSSPEAAAISVRRMTSDQYFKQGGKEASDAYLASLHK